MDILARNGDAEYLVKCGLAGTGASDRATFRAKVPMATYDDLKLYILPTAIGRPSCQAPCTPFPSSKSAPARRTATPS